MAKVFEEQMRSSDYNDLSFEERLGIMVEREAIERENRRLKAKLRLKACMEDIDYSHPRGLDKSLMMSLDDRHGIHSTIIAGQLPIEHWHDAIGNPTLADAPSSTGWCIMPIK